MFWFKHILKIILILLSTNKYNSKSYNLKIPNSIFYFQDIIKNNLKEGNSTTLQNKYHADYIYLIYFNVGTYLNMFLWLCWNFES